MALKRRTRLTARQVKRLLRDLPFIISGQVKDRHGIRSTFMGVLARTLYRKIHEAYLAKSTGASDELGNTWKPLSHATKVYRLRKKNLAKHGFRQRERGLLTKKQNTTWKGVYAHTLSNLMTKGLDYKTAQSIAAGAAWNFVKAKGAQTKQQVAQDRDFPIMVDSGRLLASLRPSKGEGRYTPNKDQIYVLRPSSLELGSKVPYADEASQERPLWPENWDEWLDEAMDEATAKTMQVLAEVIR